MTLQLPYTPCIQDCLGQPSALLAVSDFPTSLGMAVTS